MRREIKRKEGRSMAGVRWGGGRGGSPLAWSGGGGSGLAPIILFRLPMMVRPVLPPSLEEAVC